MDVQLQAFRDMISTNPVVAAILERMPSLAVRSAARSERGNGRQNR